MNKCEYSVKYIDSFVENNNKFIVTEYCDSNLRNLLQEEEKENGFSINEIKKIFCQLNAGLKYLINIKKFLHRDLKPDNILINEIKNKDGSINYKYKLCDYGIAKYLEKKYLSTNVGTKLYEAPEIKNNKKYTNKSDLFSIGIILYELYYGNKENELTQKKIFDDIKKGLKIKNINDDMNEFNDLKNLIEKCLKNEENRIDWNEYFAHKFFNYEIELIVEIQEKDLNKNIKLIGFDIFNNNNTELYINDKKEIFTKEYKFTKAGYHIIKFIFNNNIIESSLENMFERCENIKFINFNIFNTSYITNMKNMFEGCINLKEIDLSLFNTSDVEDMYGMFSECLNLKEINLSSFNTSNVKDMQAMFANCLNLKEINLTSFNTTNVENMNEMFLGCYKLKEINLSSFNTINVKYMGAMFTDCKNLKEINLSSFNTTNVEDMNDMFNDCINLEEIDFSSFNTINVKDISSMFSSCLSLKKIDLSSFNTLKVENMSRMFNKCYNLKKINLSSFNIYNVKKFDYMFYDCKNLKKLLIKKEFKNNFEKIIENNNILFEFK